MKNKSAVRNTFGLLLTCLIFAGCTSFRNSSPSAARLADMVTGAGIGIEERAPVHKRCQPRPEAPTNGISFSGVYYIKAQPAHLAPDDYFLYRFWPDNKCARLLVTMKGFPSPSEGDRPKRLQRGCFTSDGKEIRIALYDRSNYGHLPYSGTLSGKGIHLPSAPGFPDAPYREISLPRTLMNEWLPHE